MKTGDNTSYLFRIILFRIIDVLLIFICGLIVHLWRFGDIDLSAEYRLFLIASAFLTLNIFSWFSLYRAWRGDSILKELTNLTAAVVATVLVITLLTFITKTGESFSRLWAGWTFVATYSSMVAYRALVRHRLRKLRSSGNNLKHIVIVGAGALGKRACDAMLSQNWAGYRPIAFFDDDISIQGATHKKIPVAGSLDDIAPFIESFRRWNGKNNQPIDQVWIALPIRSQKRIEELQGQLQDTAANVYFIPDLYGFNLANYSVEEKIGLPVMNMSASAMQGTNAVLKRLEDLIISSAALIALTPVFIIVAILIKRESPGPIFFKQRRYGVDGKEITVWKFRSMKVTEDGTEVKQATRVDPRITKIGGFLRKSSLDELPQLINVLQGSMSLVGPRPHAVAHNEFYRGKVKGYMARHKMRPGITGWAQVNGHRGETAEIRDMEARIRYDLEYIKNWSLTLDLRIILRTFQTVLDTKNTY